MNKLIVKTDTWPVSVQETYYLDVENVCRCQDIDVDCIKHADWYVDETIEFIEE